MKDDDYPERFQLFKDKYHAVNWGVSNSDYDFLIAYIEELQEKLRIAQDILKRVAKQN